MKIAILIIWLITGLLNLFYIPKIPKVSYGLMWGVLMLKLIADVIE